MFSGLTNQVSSWMGAAKGEPQDEEVPTPTKEAPAPTPPAQLDLDPATSGGTGATTSGAEGARGKLEMLSSVKSQMSGWLGGVPLPGLRRDAAPEPAPQPEPEPAPAAPASSKDDDDNSSATGGADSAPGSAGGSPTEDAPGAPPLSANVTEKAVAGAKSLGSFLYSAVNKAGAKVSEASAKIKRTVEDHTLLAELNKEQAAFIAGQDTRGAGDVALPWRGAHDEPALKEECLSLSTDRRNFVRAPPAGVDFQFDYDATYPLAQAIMQEDPNLEKMRFDLVPKVITEENFWRNYFYRLSLIVQAHEADAAAAEPQPEPAA